MSQNFVKTFLAQCQNCILRVHSNNLKRKILVGQFLISHRLWTRSELFLALCRKFFGRGIQICNLHIHRKLFRKILLFFQWRIFLFFSRTISEVHQSSGKFFQLGCQYCILHRGIFFFEENYLSGKLMFCLFSDNDRKIFGQLPENNSTELSKLHSASPEEKFEGK